MIARLAEGQHGVVSRRQLNELGVTPSAIRTRLSSHRLHRIRNGVYSLAPSELSTHARALAAVLSCEATAVLSYRSAAWLWGLTTPATSWHVSTTSRSRSRPGVVIHKVQHLQPPDLTTIHQIPVTALPRTLIDTAVNATPRQLERLLDQAEILRILDVAAIHATIARSPRRAGVRNLLNVIQAHTPGTTPTRNRFEELFLELCDRVGLPRPQINVPLVLPNATEVTVDCLWRRRRVVAELDGRETHRTVRAFEEDRLRDTQLQLAGYAITRITWRRLQARPEQVAEDLRALLGRPGQTLGRPAAGSGRV